MLFRVAVVEDEETDAALLRKYLCKFAEDEKIRVETNVFTDGMAFLEAYKNEYDLVLMDIEMPMYNAMDPKSWTKK